MSDAYNAVLRKVTLRMPSRTSVGIRPSHQQESRRSCGRHGSDRHIHQIADVVKNIVLYLTAVFSYLEEGVDCPRQVGGPLSAQEDARLGLAQSIGTIARRLVHSARPNGPDQHCSGWTAAHLDRRAAGSGV